jgi:hypothetical protein
MQRSRLVAFDLAYEGARGGDMNKNILAAALRLDEAVTFGRIEPFHGNGARCHRV